MTKNPDNYNKKDSLLESLVLYSKLYYKPYTSEAIMSGLPSSHLSSDKTLLGKNSSRSLFSRAASRAGLKTTLVQRPIVEISKLQLPMIILLSNEYSCILEDFSKEKNKAKIIHANENEPVEEWVDIEKLENEYLGFAFMLKKPYSHGSVDKKLSTHKKHWFWDTLKLSKSIYKDVLLASLLINLFVLATPLFTMNVYDRVIPNSAIETLWMFTFGVVTVYILDVFLKFTRSYLLELAAKKSDIIMSSIIFEKVLDLNLSSYPKSVGSFASNIKDFDAIRSFLTNATLTIIIDFPFALIFLLLIAYIGGTIVFIPIFISIIILSYAFLIKKPLQRSIESSHEASARKNGILIESLQNIETIKAFGLSGKMQWMYEEATGEIAKKSINSRLISSSIPNVTAFLVQLNTIICVVYGVYLISAFHLTMGGLIAVIILSSRTVSPLGQAAGLITGYEDAKASYTLINSIISRPIERPEGKEFIKREILFENIEFRNVSFSYPETNIEVLKDVSFTINKGEKVAMLGMIGSGKSTLSKLLLKLYEPTSGSILIDGIDIKQIDPANLRKSISYVPQEINLFQGTVKENILNNYKYYTDEEILDIAKVAGVDDFVKIHPLGYDMQINERSIGLSGGQKQTVGIARALLNDTNTLLFDEPMNAMDQTTERSIINRLKSVIEGKTLLLITQKLTTLDLCERVIVLHNGKKIMDGSKPEILKQLGSK
ncbi:type I secretion system permease/ATPase [Arcobacter sp. KX21116]|uniref:type I secretion system permease/ATPase n=1 Tax=Arcobacter iocasae TaxID=2906515 RepID=UPI0035D43062